MPCARHTPQRSHETAQGHQSRPDKPMKQTSIPTPTPAESMVHCQTCRTHGTPRSDPTSRPAKTFPKPTPRLGTPSAAGSIHKQTNPQVPSQQGNPLAPLEPGSATETWPLWGRHPEACVQGSIASAQRVHLRPSTRRMPAPTGPCAEDAGPTGQAPRIRRGSQPPGTADAPSRAHQPGAATRKGPHRRRQSTLRR